MTTPCCPLGVISRNIEKRKELTPMQRGKIIGAKIAGATNAQIQRYFGVAEMTVRRTIANFKNNDTGLSHKRSGWPRCYSE